jgi:hypothetical protein
MSNLGWILLPLLLALAFWSGAGMSRSYLVGNPYAYRRACRRAARKRRPRHGDDQ